MFDLEERSGGVLLHLTSLPGPHGNGDLGAAAYEFARELASAGQRLWQMLPIVPIGEGNSPYSGRSAFAGESLLIDLAALARDGLLDAPASPPPFPRERVDYPLAAGYREKELRRAFAAFQGKRKPRSYARFRERAAVWLDDFALFSALRTACGGQPWNRWERDVRLRRPAALARARRELAREVELHLFQQWLFDEQWLAFKRHCNDLGIALIGDVPFFVAYDSADVWAHRELFELDAEGRPTVVAGVPPDFFSKTGQLWGNPQYRWPAIEQRRYRWWIDRFAHALDRFDALRLDHFIGYYRTWHVPADAPTAERGTWVAGPRDALFRALKRALGRDRLPFIAEDLGLVTPEVRELRERIELPGTKLLQFAFGNDLQARDFRPHNFPRRAAAYTGTHDNDTVLGWFFDRGGRERTAEQTEIERRNALAYLGVPDADEIHWHLLRCVFASVANLAIVPMQDVLGLGPEARMNRPGTATGNWEWRMLEGAFDATARARLNELSRLYDRLPLTEAAERRKPSARLAAKEARR
jgi:4-alpha-glucanotransferase